MIHSDIESYYMVLMVLMIDNNSNIISYDIINNDYVIIDDIDDYNIHIHYPSLQLFCHHGNVAMTVSIERKIIL